MSKESKLNKTALNKYELESLANAKMEELETLEKLAESQSLDTARMEKVLGFIDRQMEKDPIATMNAVKRSAIMMDIAVFYGMADEQESAFKTETKIIVPGSPYLQ